jgi:hypothetical protein
MSTEAGFCDCGCTCRRMRHAATAFLIALLAGCAGVPDGADPASDAPEHRVAAPGALKHASSYDEALRVWRNAEDVNAWIGAKFEYDRARAMRLSETQRTNSGRLPIHPPDAFYAAPSGICVDLARFGVEALRAIDPSSKPAYVMIEFDPVSLAGNTLRRHWIASYERNGMRYFFADSKRPGHIAGPYPGTASFVEAYARYRGRKIVAFRELNTYERRMRTRATAPAREARP